MTSADGDKKQRTVFTQALTPAQATALHDLLRREGWRFEDRPYTICFAQKERLAVAVYEKGPKVVVQGRGAEDFVRFRLEPEILGEARLGYEEVLTPERFAPHFGIDESGKGDFFGPLVIAGVYVDREIARAMMEAGVQDSKRITSDARIRQLAAQIKETPGIATSVVAIGPERYNQLYAKMRNVNRLLAWGHARVIENLAEQRPDCPRALCDQFADPEVTARALLQRGRRIQMEQRTKAEVDPAVAAASILARERFIDWLASARREFGVTLPKGASAQVKQAAADLIASQSVAVLERVAKTHFRTAHEVAPDHFAAPPPKPAFWGRRPSATEPGQA